MSEILNQNSEEESSNNPWDELSELPDDQFNKQSSEEKILPLFKKVNFDYKISSMPFDNKEDAYKEIEKSWQGVEDVTTYFDNGKWYIISK